MKRLLCVALCVASPARAATFADLSAIDRAAEDFAGAAVVPVDRRMRLAACPAPLNASWYGTRRDTVLVRCPGAEWRVFVSLQGGSAVAASAPVIVKGDAVAITMSGPGFSISQAGEALESGVSGGWIKVRSVTSGTATLRARVVRPGVVGIDLP